MVHTFPQTGLRGSTLVKHEALAYGVRNRPIRFIRSRYFSSCILAKAYDWLSR